YGGAQAAGNRPCLGPEAPLAAAGRGDGRIDPRGNDDGRGPDHQNPAGAGYRAHHRGACHGSHRVPGPAGAGARLRQVHRGGRVPVSGAAAPGHRGLFGPAGCECVMTQLIVEHLQVHYGDLIGVEDVSLTVPQGSTDALLGANGAGKSTTLKAIMGLLPPTRGRIEWNGVSVAGLPAYEVVRHGIILSPEGWRLFTSLTVEQNLLLGATTIRDRQ